MLTIYILKGYILVENDHVGFKVCRLSKLIKRELDSHAPPEISGNTTAINRWVISYLYHNRDKDIFQKDIENLFSIRRSTASNMLQLMEQKGLISRVSVEGDARLKKLVLTPRAEEIYLRAQSVKEELDERLIADVSKEELDICVKVLEKMSRNLLHDEDDCCAHPDFAKHEKGNKFS